MHLFNLSENNNYMFSQPQLCYANAPWLVCHLQQRVFRVSYLHSHALCSVKLMNISFCCLWGFILLICKKKKQEEERIKRNSQVWLKVCRSTVLQSACNLKRGQNSDEETKVPQVNARDKHKFHVCVIFSTVWGLTGALLLTLSFFEPSSFAKVWLANYHHKLLISMSQIPTICINSSGWKRAFICNFFFFCLFFVNSQRDLQYI